MRHRLHRACALVAIVVAASAPAASASGQDLRSPDARTPFEAPSRTIDLRSPDARVPVVLPSAPPAASIVRVERPDAGFDWGDAGIGAAALLLVLAVPAGVVVVGTARRRPAAGRSGPTAVA